MRMEYDNQECQEGEKEQFYSRVPLEQWRAALRVVRAAEKCYDRLKDVPMNGGDACAVYDLYEALEALPEGLSDD